jgi:hypothetical protein
VLIHITIPAGRTLRHVAEIEGEDAGIGGS